MGSIKWVIATIVIIWLITASTAYELSQLQWDKGTTGTLRRDGVISYMGYSVKVIAFNEPVESEKNKNIPREPVEAYVGLNISNNGTFVNKTFLGRGESYISPDGELKVTALELPGSSGKEWLFESYDPWTKLELSPRGKPRLELTVNMETEYISAPNTEIVAKVILKNPGTADILNVDMVMITELPLLRGNLKFHYDKIQKGGQFLETVTFSAPIITDLTKYNLITNVTGFDVKEISQNKVLLKTISLIPPPRQIPILKKTSNNKIYLKDYNMVSLSFKNTLNSDLKNITITDSLPKGFKQISNNTLSWLVDVPANGEWTSRYILKPIEADKDGIIFPAAKAEFRIKEEYYMVQSNKPETIVYGPNIQVDKKTDVSEIKPGDTITITVSAINRGSTPTRVSVIDTVPGDLIFLSGTTKGEEFLEVNKEIRISYTIKSDSNSPFKLPAAEAEYFELGERGSILTAKSQEPYIRIKPPPTPVPTPGPTPEPTIEPEIEALLIPESQPEVETVPWYEETKEPEQPPVTIENEQPIKPSIDKNVILNVIMGCDKINGIDPQNIKLSAVCNLVS